MKFTEILEELRKGKKVTREKWEKPGDSCAIDFIMYDQKKDKCEFYRDCKYYDEFVWVYEDIIAEDWKTYEEKKTNKKWKPQYGEKYYTISTRGTIDFDNFVAENNTDAVRLLLGNVFETEEKAEHMVEKLKIITKLRELSNGDFYRNCTEVKYVIWYDSACKEIKINTHEYIRELPFSIYFATKKDAEKAVLTIGEDNLKKYYFDVED